jgi:hypothetical protein
MRKTTEQTGPDAQIAMEFALEATADATTARLLEELRAGIADMTPGRAVELLNVQPSVLSESVGARARRQFQLRWFARLLLAFPPQRRFTVVRALAELCGFDLLPRRKLTVEQRGEELERALLSFGEAGRRKLDEVGR